MRRKGEQCKENVNWSINDFEIQKKKNAKKKVGGKVGGEIIDFAPTFARWCKINVADVHICIYI